jgi:hypothetical protein
LLEELPIRLMLLDYSIGDSCHLGGDRRQRLAAQIGITRVGANIPFVFVFESILAQPDGDLTGHPESKAQACIAALGQLRTTPLHSGLVLRKIKTAILEKLAVMPKAA